jgi:hypothetical protein
MDIYLNRGVFRGTLGGYRFGNTDPLRGSVDLEAGYLGASAPPDWKAHTLGLMETKRVTFVERDSSRVDTVSLAGGVARTEAR